MFDGWQELNEKARFVLEICFFYAGRSAAGVELHGDRTNEQAGVAEQSTSGLGACEWRHGNG